LTVTNTPNAVINWQSFSIGSGQTTNFVQQSASSSVLNRVIGPDPSTLLGALTSNGKVFLINPAGILVGQGARINVAGLVASTLNLSNTDFIAGKLNFGATPNAGIVQNNGTITTPEGGSVYLVAPQVENYGVINTPKGETILAAGNTVQLVDTGTPGVTVQVTGSSNAATNLGQILADSGQIGVVGAVVKNSGTISANSLVSQGGKIFLKAGNSIAAGGTISAQGVGGGNISVLADKKSGTVNVTGTLDASAPNSGNGGFIETSAAHVEVANSAKVTTAASSGLYGTWLIDPDGFTIAASGGDMTGIALSTALGLGDVVIDSTQGSGNDGNVNVNDAVTWSAHLLTLNATNDVNINAVMTASNTASLDLEPGSGNVNVGMNASGFTGQVNFPGRSGTYLADNVTPILTINGNAFTVISSLGAAADATTAPVTTTLQGMAATANLSGYYALGSDISASTTSSWNSGAGFTPVGDNANNFTGTLDGLGHTVSNLVINRHATDNVGLFGVAGTGSVIRNVGLVGGSVSGNNNVGGLVGYNSGTVSNSYTTSSVSGNYYVGGLAGENYGTSSNSYTTGNVSGNYYVGGLAGENKGTSSNSFVTGSVSGTGYYIGGLVGYNNYGAISNSYAMGGSVTGSRSVGGLVGYNNNGTVNTSYAMDSVSGIYFVGGLVGYNYGSGTVDSSYAAGSVSGTSSVGGLVGHNTPLSAISVTNSFWDTTTSGRITTEGGGRGMSTADMQNLANFTSATLANRRANPGWDFTNTWVMYDGHTYPLLRFFMTPLTVTVNNATKTYDGLAYTGSGGVTYSVTPNFANLQGTLSYAGSYTGIINAGSYAVTPSGLYSNQQGYLISYASGTLTVNPAPLTVSGTTIVGNKVYDGTTTATLSGGTLSGVISGDAVTLTQSGIFASKNVGTGIAVTATDSLGGASASNYTLTEPTGLAANITAASLTAAITGSPSKVYDGTLTATLTSANYSLSGFVAGEGATVLKTLGTYNSQNVLTANSISTTLASGDFSANTGTLLSNYTLPTSASGAASIRPAPLTATVAAPGKTYDGTRTATPTLTITGGLVGTETVTATGTASFNSKDVLTANLVTVNTTALVNGSNGGLASNYSLAAGETVASSITPLAITLSGTPAFSNKVYDGTTLATLTGSTLNGVISGDIATLAGTFASPNVGTGIAVTVTLGGAAAGNYTLTGATSLTANIIAKALTVTGTMVANKTYDGTKAATLSGGTLSGVISGDKVSLTQSGIFASQNVGTNIAVTATDILGGASAGNYTLTEPTGLLANITALALTASGITVANKTYDGTTAATLSGGTLSGMISGDTVTLTQSGTFASKNVGTNIPVTVTLGGASAGNYTLAGTTSLAANITPLAITVTGEIAANKVYDGTTAATLSGGTLNGVISGDTVSLTHSGTFASKNVGTHIAVTASDSLGGASAGNYTFTEPTGLAANITPLALTVSGITVANKTYDGTTAATLSGGTLGGVISGDKVTLPQSGTFASKNVGTDIPVTVTLGGAAAGNYTLDGATGLAANITPLAITVSGEIAANKVYDGTTAATLNGGTLSGVISGDTVSLTHSGIFASKNVGTGIAITVTDSLAGNDAGNYTLSEPTGLAANITAAPLTAVIIGSPNKVYDGTTTATLTPANFSLGGFVAGESATVGKTLGTYNSPNVLTANSISATLAPGDFSANTGTSLANYTLPASAAGAGSITPQGPSLTANAATQIANRFVLSGTPFGAVNMDSYVISPNSLFSTWFDISYNNNTLTILPSQVDPTNGAFEIWHGVLRTYTPHLLEGM